MTYELENTPEKDLDLASDKVQEKIVGIVKENWTNGRKDRASREKDWERCWKAFAMYVDPDLYPDAPWRNNFSLAWSFQSAINGASQIKNMIMPSDENFFKLKSVNSGNILQVRNSEAMTKYLKRIFKKGGFNRATNLFVMQGAITGCSAMKVLWKQKYGKTDEKTQGLVFDAPYYEFIKMQDFVVYPANSSDISQSMHIHRVFRHISDVKAMDAENGGPDIYRNTNDIDSKASLDASIKQDKELSDSISEILGVKEPKAPKGQVELLEAHGDFTVEGKVYRDHIAVVANRKHLIRFEPSPYSRKPFLFTSFREIPGTAYGMGFIEPGLSIQGLAETMDNMMMDELLLKMHGQYKYVADGVFDPDSFEIRPGGLHEVKDLQNIQRIDNVSNLNTPLTVKEAFKAEYEETTGILKYSKGSDAGQAHTLGEAEMLTQNNTVNLQGIAKHLNETFLEPAVEITYDLIHNFRFTEVEKIIKYTGIDPEIAMQGIPLSEMDIDIVGLSTVLDKQQDIQNMERLFTNVLPTPAGALLDPDHILDEYLRALGIDDPERLKVTPEIREQIKSAFLAQILAPLQQQQMMLQQASSQPPQSTTEVA